ncbi:MAG: HAD-IA family hydrolase [Melioribacteraceae bacterium]|nr:HAD-IA family hydrolase [Melioribacteraceae bacterium]
MKKFDGIIFDIDGTLTSTNELIIASFNHVTEKYLERTYTYEEIVALFGPTENVILKDIMGNNYDNACSDYYEFYNQNHLAMADIYPGMKEIVEMIYKKKIHLGIYTGKGRKSSEITLNHIGIYDYFDPILTGDDIDEPKPSAKAITSFVNRFDLKKENVLMIGDAPADIIAAKGAGTKIASVVWDSYAKEEVLGMGSDYYFHSVGELKEFILKSI